MAVFNNNIIYFYNLNYYNRFNKTFNFITIMKF